MSGPTSPHPSSPSLSSHQLTASLNAARRGESPTPSTPSPRRPHPNLTSTARKQALREFYNLDKSKASGSTTELDKPEFDGKGYADKVVHEKNLRTLIALENELVQGLVLLIVMLIFRYPEPRWREKISCL